MDIEIKTMLMTVIALSALLALLSFAVKLMLDPVKDNQREMKAGMKDNQREMKASMKDNQRELKASMKDNQRELKADMSELRDKLNKKLDKVLLNQNK